MKLIDILVEELPKRGGWDAKWHQCAQDGNGEVCFFTDGEINFRRSFDAWSIPSRGVARHDGKARFWLLLADDYQETIITREQYEAALAAKNEGWIEWGGGECPVPRGTLVDVRYRDGRQLNALSANDGTLNPRDASFVFWRNDGSEKDIIAYRLHQPQEADRVRAAAWNAYAGITEADEEANLNECIGQDAAPVWNGEGLPPVGCECEVSVDGGRSWCTYRAINEKNGARLIEISNFTEEFQNNNWIFRPLRTEAERKRDDICDKIYGAMTNAKRKDNRSDMAEEIYDAIAAGKIHGVKLED